ncbi:hypothetical protein BATDEDRAFT_34348 [Batrachochytrium dendrobatidis JAM81]|uniref:Uncharacterized protein n=2 Tax=Batrachochytrium dendrobatidis TaxID=109871 RepID=F4NX75_BATDJ|nr:uncharacterized protein BATDEDRAFT_34348 [Batrachochytrium dendrobatidis JAM81]EGF82314.1 hypothetical protein BATDEDRAFT_34348 [Batrachochytrium dendrobatidis JAM81]OAJ40010.1 hypothetical protein, variant [Batrachochytrium dendrobatidis JEL423]|eukprot:XP_006676765.1 hypothetical protein BATDEDRAFT_34348 [Batrachochytrium dendrobatidis JAM81]
MSLVTIQLLEGVTGGFMPARLRRKVTITFNPADNVAKVERCVEDERATKRNQLMSYQSKPELSIDAVKSLVDQTVNAFKELPMEEPKGGSDVYRMDTTIIVDAPNFQWRNTPNQGCSYVPSSVIPTDDQKAAFTLFVERINKLADEHAVVEGGLTC